MADDIRESGEVRYRNQDGEMEASYVETVTVEVSPSLPFRSFGIWSWRSYSGRKSNLIRTRTYGAGAR